MRSEPAPIRGPSSNGPRVEQDANPNLIARFECNGVVPWDSSAPGPRIFAATEDVSNQLLQEVEPPFRFYDCRFGRVDILNHKDAFDSYVNPEFLEDELRERDIHQLFEVDARSEALLRRHIVFIQGDQHQSDIMLKLVLPSYRLTLHDQGIRQHIENRWNYQGQNCS